jgi:hypothetical protein
MKAVWSRTAVTVTAATVTVIVKMPAGRRNRAAHTAARSPGVPLARPPGARSPFAAVALFALLAVSAQMAVSAQIGAATPVEPLRHKPVSPQRSPRSPTVAPTAAEGRFGSTRRLYN